MDPLSIVAASFSIAGAIAKASVAIFEFSREAKDAAEDLRRVNGELQALSSILEPLTRSLSTSLDVSEGFAQQLQGSLEGCSLVVIQVADLIEKYRREGAWTKTKWVMVGRGDMEKLRASLEAYKMALSLGLHAVSVTIQENIKRDTCALRSDNQVLQHDVSAIKVNTDEILARVNCIRHLRGSRSVTRVEKWVEEIEVLTSYAETTYQGTVTDSDEGRPAETTYQRTVTDTDEVHLAETAYQGTVTDSDVVHPAETAYQGTAIDSNEGSSAGPGEGQDIPSIQEWSERIWADIDYSDTLATSEEFARLMESELLKNGWVDQIDVFPEMRRLSRKREYSQLFSRFERRAATTRLPRIQEESDVTTSDPAWTLSPVASAERPSGPTSTSSSVGSMEHSGKVADDNKPTKLPAGNGNLDLIVGIDIGEASTAVIWMAQDTPAHCIHDWPDGAGVRVPTSVSLPNSYDQLQWGFQCYGDKDVQSLSLMEFLELSDDTDLVRRIPNAMRIVWVGFLSQLYDHIRKSISKKLRIDRRTWTALTVEFHFTLPDIIREVQPSSVERALSKFKEILREAEIGTEERHCAILSLTETEAVATAVLGERDRHDLSTLVVKVGEGSVTIVEPSWETLPRSHWHSLHGVVTLARTTEINEIFAEHIRPRLRKYSTIAIVETGPAVQSSADALRDVLKRRRPSIRRAPHAVPEGGPYMTAAKGLLVRRRPWHLKEQIAPPLFRNVYTPSIFIRLSDPSNILDTTGVKDYMTLLPYSTNAIVCLEAETMRRQRPKSTRVYFNIFFTFDSEWEASEGTDNAEDIPGLTKLCTVQSCIDADSFEAFAVKDKWYSISRTAYAVKFFLRVFVLEPSKVGPRFQLFVEDGLSHAVRCETEVTWYTEPPNMVWPLKTVVGQGAYYEAPALGAGFRTPRMILRDHEARQAARRTEQEKIQEEQDRVEQEMQNAQ